LGGEELVRRCLLNGKGDAMMSVMLRINTASLVFLFAGISAVRADGYKFAFDGHIVPEREQRAFIEWADGVETLFVAARSDPTADGTVWIVPVRAAAAAVHAEPVDEFPVVTHYQTLAARAEHQLRVAAAVAAIADTGGLLCPLFMPGCASTPAPATEKSRVERLGMVVTVVSAESRAAIERYLDEQGVNRSAADLSPLNPYFGTPGFAFVCGWMAKRDTPATANGLKISFPAPTIWFPLRPTRAYASPIETVVYVRGFVKPAAGCDLSGLACEYIYGKIETKGVGQTFGTSGPVDPTHFYYLALSEELTRVTLTTDPQKWDRDLELVSGTTTKGTVALAVLRWPELVGPLWSTLFASSLLGALLGLSLPRFIVPTGEMRKVDWILGALTGAAISLTIWFSVLVFLNWRNFRFSGRDNVRSGGVPLVLLAIVHAGISAAVCLGLAAWLKSAG
jgi:hypothetical protein